MAKILTNEQRAEIAAMPLHSWLHLGVDGAVYIYRHGDGCWTVKEVGGGCRLARSADRTFTYATQTLRRIANRKETR